MPNTKLIYLGNCIRSARNSCGLTQQELADQSNIAVKTIQNIEKGRMNPSYEILFPIVKRLGISANMLFCPDIIEDDAEIEQLVSKLQSCTPENRKIILNTVTYLAEQLISMQ